MEKTACIPEMYTFLKNKKYIILYVSKEALGKATKFGGHSYFTGRRENPRGGGGVDSLPPPTVIGLTRYTFTIQTYLFYRFW